MKLTARKVEVFNGLLAVVIALTFILVLAAQYSELYAGNCCANCPDYCECASSCSGNCIKGPWCGTGEPPCRGTAGTNCCYCDKNPI